MKILRGRMYEATKEYLRGQREKHIANAEVMLVILLVSVSIQM